MNKVQLAEWLLKRVGGKVDDLRSADTTEIAEFLGDDIDTYLGMLGDIIKEVILP